MTANREVVITGLGIVSPIGIGRADFEQSLRDQRSGVAAINQYDTSTLGVPFGAELKHFQAKLYVKPRKSLKVMCHEIQMGVASAALAVEDASLDVEQIDPDRFGVVYGCPMLYSDTAELADLFKQCEKDSQCDFTQFGESFSKQLQPLWMLKYLPNMAASHIGIAHNARGANNSIVMGDVSSLLAIIEATTMVQRGHCDVMLTGGTGNRLNLTGVAYRGDSNLSHNADPEKASRPFDAARDGMVIGEASSTILLEEREHAEKRGAKILGRIAGYGTTHAGSDLEAGMSNAIARSIQLSLNQAGNPAVGQVNAHGQSDKAHDVREANAIASVVGEDVPVTAPKSYFGNVGSASGALELAASLCTSGEVLPTLNYEEPDPNCNVSVSNEVRPSKVGSILKLNQAGTGQAVALFIDNVS